MCQAELGGGDTMEAGTPWRQLYNLVHRKEPLCSDSDPHPDWRSFSFPSEPERLSLHVLFPLPPFRNVTSETPPLLQVLNISSNSFLFGLPGLLPHQ